MAATRIIPMHVNKGKTIQQCVKARLDYASNPEKTEEGQFVSSYACDPKTVTEEFMLSKKEYYRLTGRHPHGDIIAYQLRQSFKPGEITPEEANQIGYELAEKLTKGNHAFIVATHTDKKHIHNHIVWNSTDLNCTRKYRNFLGSFRVVQRISDELCLKHGLSVIKPRPYKDRIKYQGHPGAPAKRGFDMLVDIQKKLTEGKGKGYVGWAKVFNAKQITQTLLFLKEKDIRDYDSLAEKAHLASATFDDLRAKIKDCDQRLDEITDLRQHIFNYAKTRDVYEKYRKGGYKKSFYEAHRQEITIHKAAKAAFNKLPKDRKPGGKLPTVKQLNEEFKEVLAEKKKNYSEYREAKKSMQDYVKAKHNIDEFMRQEQLQNGQIRKNDRHTER